LSKEDERLSFVDTGNLSPCSSPSSSSSSIYYSTSTGVFPASSEFDEDANVVAGDLSQQRYLAWEDLEENSIGCYHEWDGTSLSTCEETDDLDTISDDEQGGVVPAGMDLQGPLPLGTTGETEQTKVQRNFRILLLLTLLVCCASLARIYTSIHSTHRPPASVSLFDLSAGLLGYSAHFTPFITSIKDIRNLDLTLSQKKSRLVYAEGHLRALRRTEDITQSNFDIMLSSLNQVYNITGIAIKDLRHLRSLSSTVGAEIQRDASRLRQRIDKQVDENHDDYSALEEAVYTFGVRSLQHLQPRIAVALRLLETLLRLDDSVAQMVFLADAGDGRIAKSLRASFGGTEVEALQSISYEAVAMSATIYVAEMLMTGTKLFQHAHHLLAAINEQISVPRRQHLPLLIPSVWNLHESHWPDSSAVGDMQSLIEVELRLRLGREMFTTIMQDWRDSEAAAAVVAREHCMEDESDLEYFVRVVREVEESIAAAAGGRTEDL